MVQSPFEYASQHLQVIGWPALVYFAWMVSKYFERITTQASKTITQIDSMATNHTPHIQEGIYELVALTKVNNDKLDSVIKAMRG